MFLGFTKIGYTLLGIKTVYRPKNWIKLEIQIINC